MNTFFFSKIKPIYKQFKRLTGLLHIIDTLSFISVTSTRINVSVTGFECCSKFYRSMCRIEFKFKNYEQSFKTKGVVLKNIYKQAVETIHRFAVLPRKCLEKKKTDQTEYLKTQTYDTH